MLNDARRSLGVGQLVISLLVAVASKSSSRERAAFVKAQGTLQAADAEVRGVENQVKAANHDKQHQETVEHDALQVLASELVADGFDRLHSIANLCGSSPSELMGMAPIARLAKVRVLVETVEASPEAQPGSKKAVRAVLDASEATTSADTACRRLRVERSTAIAKRNALLKPWRTAISLLRAALRYGDEQDGTQNEVMVFGQPERRKKSLVPAPAPAS
jgi:hypothetical protein